MSEQLQQAIAAKFAGISNEQLIQRINHAADFGYDDEEFELNRRLGLRGWSWRWAPPGLGQQDVEVFDPTTGDPVAEF